jgi:hypothetical protein
MAKHRPYIPPPIMTPPSVVVPRETDVRPAPARVMESAVPQSGGDFVPDAPAATAPTASAPSSRVARVELFADRIVLYNPTIKLDAHVFLPGTNEQTDKLRPATATIMHDEIIIDELGIIWPVSRAHILTK